MSLRAKAVRLMLRWLMKPSGRKAVPIEVMRRRVANFARWVADPPSGVRVARTAVGGVTALRVAAPASREDWHMLFLHGGGYVAASSELYRPLLWRLSAAAQARVAAIDYRLAPEHPFPAALDDAVAAWRGLLAEGVDPLCAVFVGDSAGGGLTLALALRLRDDRLPLPVALVALSPWTDLALTGGSLRTNADADPLLITAGAQRLAACYLAGGDPRQPYASPLYGDPAGLPPTLIQVGGDEILLDDSVRMAERMRAAGCEVTLEVWRRMPHVWHVFAPVMPEARQAIARIGAFAQQRLALAGGEAPSHPVQLGPQTPLRRQQIVSPP